MTLFSIKNNHPCFLVIALIVSSPLSLGDSDNSTNGSNGFTLSLTRKPSRTSSMALSPSAASSPPSAGVSSLITSMDASYIMTIRLGDPPFDVQGIFDTSNDLIWIQCRPCTCFNQTTPVFDPKNSSSYGQCKPDSPKCKRLGAQPNVSKVDCPYTWNSVDRSYSEGILSFDTITVGTGRQSIVIRKAVFGCGQDNWQKSILGPESGIFAFGYSPYSILSQMGSIVEQKFSYCLTGQDSISDTSEISFGKAATVSGNNTLVTPLITRKGRVFYYLDLQSITIGKTKVVPSFGNKQRKALSMIINTGTAATFLPAEFYKRVERTIKIAVKGTQVQTLGGLCYYINVANNVHTLRVVMNFKNANVTLKGTNIFLGVEENVVCLAMDSTREEAIYGSLAQVDFLVGLDLNKNTVTFKPKNCAVAHK